MRFFSILTALGENIKGREEWYPSGPLSFSSHEEFLIKAADNIPKIKSNHLPLKSMRRKDHPNNIPSPKGGRCEVGVSDCVKREG